MRRSTWHLRAGAVVVAWLLVLVVTAGLGVLTSVPAWLVVHLLLLGAVSNAILIWSSHFAAALLRSPAPADRRHEAIRLVAFNLGAIAVVVGMTATGTATVVAGSLAVAGAGAWHAGALVTRLRRALPSRFGSTVRYYVAAGLLLPVGVGLGVVLAPDHLDGATHARVALAHVAINVLGWVGLTVIGTLVTLWPTMLHTQVADGAERAARRALPLLVAAVSGTAVAALIGLRLVAATALAVYLGGLVIAARPLWVETRRRPPTTYATMSVLAGLAWFAASVAALALVVVTAHRWETAADVADRLAAPLLLGFVAQVLLGALTYLVPVVLGGGPAITRTTSAALATAGPTRLAVTNAGVVALALPLPWVARAVAALLVLAACGSFLPLAVRAVSLARRREPGGASSRAQRSAASGCQDAS